MLEELRIGAMSSGAEAAGLSLWVLFLIFALVAVLLWNLAAYARRGPGVADGLFLRLSFDGGVGHLLRLDAHRAVFVTESTMARGQRLRIDLGSLPGYPDERGFAFATVTAVRRLERDPAAFAVRVRFERFDHGDRRSLHRYLRVLTGQLSHA